MVITAYSMTWAQALALRDWMLSEGLEDDPEWETLEEALEEEAHKAHPYYDTDQMNITFASRYEQEMLELIDEAGIDHTTTRTETSE